MKKEMIGGKKAGYEIVDDILFFMLDKKMRSISEISNLGFEWHQAKIYLQYMAKWGLVEKISFGKRTKFKISKFARENFLKSFRSIDYAENVANLFDRLILVGQWEKANSFIIKEIEKILFALDKKLIEKKDVIKFIGLLVNKLDYEDYVNEFLWESMLRIESEHYYLHEKPEFIDFLISNLRKSILFAKSKIDRLDLFKYFLQKYLAEDAIAPKFSRKDFECLTTFANYLGFLERIHNRYVLSDIGKKFISTHIGKLGQIFVKYSLLNDAFVYIIRNLNYSKPIRLYESEISRFIPKKDIKKILNALQLINFIKIKNNIIFPELIHGKRSCFLKEHLLEYISAYILQKEGFNEVITDFYLPSEKLEFDIVAFKQPKTILICEFKSHTGTIKQEDVQLFYEKVRSFYTKASRMFFKNEEPLIKALFITTSYYDDLTINFVEKVSQKHDKIELKLIDRDTLINQLKKHKIPTCVI